MRSFALALLVLLPLAAWGGETGYATREVELRAEPVAGSSVVATLAKGEKFEITGGEKAWVQVKAGSRSGWTLLFYVMKSEPPQGASTGRTMSELWNLGTDRDKGQITSTIGVRGIDEEQLRAAHFDAEQLRRLESFGLAKEAGDAFAKEGALAARQVNYLAEPAR